MENEHDDATILQNEKLTQALAEWLENSRRLQELLEQFKEADRLAEKLVEDLPKAPEEFLSRLSKGAVTSGS